MRRAEGPPVVPITPVQPGPPGAGGGSEPGVPGWPVEIPEIVITLPPIETPGISLPPIEVPGVEVPPIEVPPVEVPPISVPPVEVPPVEVTVPRIEVPPVEVPRVEIPQMPDVVSDLRRLVTNTLFNFDLPKLKDILGLFPDPMLKVYTVRNYVLVQPPPMANWAVWWPPSGYRYIMAGPMFIESDFYSDQVTFGVQVDSEWITQEGGVALSSSMVLDVPARYFVRGEEIYVAFINNTDVTFKVWFTFLVVAATQEYYERWWAPLVRHTYESVKWTIDWFTRR